MTSYSWVQIACNGGTNATVSIQTAYARTTSTVTINQYSTSLSQTITMSANAKGGFPDIAEFSAGVSNTLAGTISGSIGLQTGSSSTESVTLGYSAFAEQGIYIELIAYQLVATTTYFAKYIPASEPSQPNPSIQDLGAIASFNANLAHFGMSQKRYTE